MYSEWVAFRIAVHAANARGMVSGGRPVWDKAVRLGLVVDLALLGRMTSSDEGSELDTSPTGHPAADVLLAFVDAHPARSLEWVVKSAPVTLLDVADPSRMGGSRWQRRRAVHLDPDDVARAKTRTSRSADSGVADSPATAATCVMAAALLLVEDDHHARLIEQCGSAGALVDDCAGYLTTIVARAGLMSAALNSGGGS